VLVGPLLLLLLVATLVLAGVLAPNADAQARWRVHLPLEAYRTGNFRHPRLLESSGVIASRRYPGGMALRFARVKRYRDDKTAAQADTVETVRQIAGRASP